MGGRHQGEAGRQQTRVIGLWGIARKFTLKQREIWESDYSRWVECSMGSRKEERKQDITEM